MPTAFRIVEIHHGQAPASAATVEPARSPSAAARSANVGHATRGTGSAGSGMRVTVTGREKDVIIVNSVNYHCHAIEAAVEAVAGVETSFVAACPVRARGPSP